MAKNIWRKMIYPDVLKQEILAEVKIIGSIGKVAKSNGISYSTVKHWVEGKRSKKKEAPKHLLNAAIRELQARLINLGISCSDKDKEIEGLSDRVIGLEDDVSVLGSEIVYLKQSAAFRKAKFDELLAKKSGGENE